MKKLGIIEEEDEATQETAEQYMCLFDNPLPAEPTMALVASPA
jgi:hypothetical protein